MRRTVPLTAKILILDIETAPTMAYVWGLFKQNIGINQIIQPTFVICWAAKWEGKAKIYYDGLDKLKRPITDKDEKLILQGMWDLLDEADIVVAHNGKGFDMKHLKAAFLRARMKPPSPYRMVDTLIAVKKEFKFISNKMAWLLQTLGLDHKMENEGFELWRKCMAGQRKAWGVMKAYNKQDVKALEELYLLMRPHMSNHPNLQLYTNLTDPGCPQCGSHECRPNGTWATNLSLFQKFVCNKCGKSFRGRKNILSKAKREFIGANIL